MNAVTSRPLAEHLWVDGDEGLQLIGGRCRPCGTTTFPRQQSCPRCTAVDSHDVRLPGHGTLWSFTVQGFPPKTPYLGPVGDGFVPYGVGYVQLDEVVIVESRLTVSDPEQLRIGMPVRLVLVPLSQDDDGTTVLTFAFAPEGGR